MDDSTVILREATVADLPKLLPFLQRELTAWGYEPHLTLERLEKALTTRWRYAYLVEEGAITAALAVQPRETAKGRAYEVVMFLVTKAHQDKILAFDALVLFGCNALRAEGIRIVLSNSPVAQSLLYGPDYIGMEVIDEGYKGAPPRIYQSGDTEAIIQRVLERRPEWQLSL